MANTGYEDYGKHAQKQPDGTPAYTSSVYAQKPERGSLAPTPLSHEYMMELYAKQTRTAVVVIAWIVGIFAVLTIIGVIVDAVVISHALSTISNNQLNSGGSGGL